MHWGSTVNKYDPDTSPRPAEWLQLDEAERLEIVTAYHRRHRIRLPNAELQAVIHVVVENQLALGEEAVARVVTRLETEGLSRHDAIHALKEAMKHKEIAEDDERRAQDDIQKLTDRYVTEVDKVLAAKEADLMAV